jgi:signal transduction histidine kinase/CheY-like chemotaxis protein
MKLLEASIRTKILALVMLVSAISLTLASASLLAWDYRQLRLDIANELSAQAGMVVENASAAISFRDPVAARETLATLAANPHLRIACLYEAGGALFAQFRPAVNPGVCPATPPASGSYVDRHSASAVVRAQVAGNQAGIVYIESDLTAVSTRQRVQGITAAIVLVLSLIVALILSANFQRLISAPIDALVKTAEEVSSRNDYSLRAKKTSGDELGVLVDAFNGMLSQIQRSEAERGVLLEREREANRLKDEFLMTLSHELRTPLHSIQGWTNLLMTGSLPPQEVPAALKRIERNVQSQARLIEDLLEVSRFAAGKFRLEMARLDLVTIAEHTLDAVRPNAAARGVTLERTFEIPSAPVIGDPNRLQQVIWNLLSNAVKFSAKGGHVWLDIRRAGDQCELTVRDAGIGIDASFLPLVFEAFRQADASTTRAYGGLGLGLSLSKRIVALHGGDIDAASAGAGLGATFTVRLPFAPSTAEGATAAVATLSGSSANALAGVTIVVVDDDSDAREVAATLLESVGARVIRAGSAAEGLRAVDQVRPAVLISDIAMPGQDGHWLLRAVRRLPGEGPRAAIALTAQVTEIERERVIETGFDEHVAKPLDFPALVETIRRRLSL